jgi:transglutaminase-like putative cysteine protease/multidrug transporter EmrE-like cation transporter
VLRVASPGWWLLGSVVLASLVLGAGYIARRYRLPAVAVSLIEAAVWAAFMTVVFLNQTALLWIIPTPESLREVPLIVGQAAEEISLGAAPLDDTVALSFMIVGAMGLLAIIVDHVVVTARMPLLAAIGIVAVSLIPAIVVRDEVDVMGFVLLAVAILALLRAETRSREKPLERDAERTAGVPATALGIGAVAIVVAVVATPLLPPPALGSGTGVGPGGGIDATLRLGDDLRRPQEIEVMRVRTNAATPPYLRATTASRFDGVEWAADRVRTVPLENELSLGTVAVDADIRISQFTTDIEVTGVGGQYLPVPYPAVAVNDLSGQWAAVPYNRTVVAQDGSIQGQTYRVVADVPRPTLEQMRALSANVAEARDETTNLPPETPAIITDLALEVTADATNDYDRLIALQRWFRSGTFDYSLEAPVEEGFDGNGADAIAKFLEVREGYCVHFASAFALMARTLRMPSRVVVGYLPGVATGEVVESQPVYSVSSRQLHAWPEVYFEGIGWIGFEPTVGLGVPTTFSAAGSTPGGPDGLDGATPGATPLPSSTGAVDPDDPNGLREDQAAGAATETVNALPVLGALLVIMLILAIPAVAREVRNRQLAVAARRGDAASAWTMVQDGAIDLSIPVPASETPRAFASRLVRDHGAPPEAMETLVRAIERASYARYGTRDFGSAEKVTDAATAVRAALLSSVTPSRRVLGLLAPRSLIVRPGSVYAGTVPAKGSVR